MSGTRFRGFLVTFNETVGITPETWGNFGDVAWGLAEFSIRQWERVAHDHIQGFLYYRNARTIEAVRKDFLPAHPHIEPMRGTIDQAIAYCSKEESRIAGPIEHGQRPTQGRRQLALGPRQREDYYKNRLAGYCPHHCAVCYQQYLRGDTYFHEWLFWHLHP